MWRIVCAGSWICLLALAGAAYVPELRGASPPPPRPRSTVKLYKSSALVDVGERCCLEANNYIKFNIIDCIKQIPRKGCYSKNYAVRVESGKWYCIKSDSKWINQQINAAKINCRPGL